MSNIGKRVKIKNYHDYSGLTGIVTQETCDTNSVLFHVTLDNGRTCKPWFIYPDPEYIQCELIEEQFMEHVVNKKENTIEKKIIGYKAPMDLYGGNIKKDSVITLSSLYKDRPIVNGKQEHYFLPKELITTWEPVFSQDFEELQIGKNDTRIKVHSSGRIEFRGEHTEINLVKALIKDFDIESRPIGTSWKTEIDKSMRFIKVGCSSEDNRFSLNELELVIKSYEKLHNS